MYKAAIIGLGRMGAEPSKRLEGKVPNGWLPISHLEAINATEGLRLSGICDLSQERVNWVSNYYNLKVDEFTDPADLLKQQYDVLTIATRTPERYELLTQALKTNVKAIVVEKPFTNNVHRAQEVIAEVSKKKILVGYGATRRAMGIYKQAKHIIQSGELGELKSITAEFGYAKLFWSLPHAVDLFLFFADSIEVEYVSGHCTIEPELLTNEKYDGDPLVETATIRFKNGIVANIVPSGGLNIRLGCTGGVLTIHGDGNHIEISRVGTYDSYYTHFDYIENNYIRSGICNIYSALVESLTNHTSFNVIAPEEIKTNQEILSAIMQSSIQGGKRLSLNNINAEFLITGRSGAFFA